MAVNITIVILTYDRRDCLSRQIENLSKINYKFLEIIVVDNGSKYSVEDIVSQDNRVVLIRNNRNQGAVGRNRGLEKANGDIIVTLDDDVYGINDEALNIIAKLMERKELAAINFKVVDEKNGKVVNWCHPYCQETFINKEFETNAISEGAVAFRRIAVDQVGHYPEYFFISHEGPDLAFRLINAGWHLIYYPDVVVMHAYEQRGRVSWRRYYYDTRNQLWLVLRNMSLFYGGKRLVVGWGSMLIYSIRDGYFRYWLVAVFDSLLGAARAWEDRVPPTLEARKRWRDIERFKPGFWFMARKRIMGKGVRI